LFQKVYFWISNKLTKNLLKDLKYNEYKSLYNSLTEPKRIILTSHASPDGDTIGSSLALYHFFRQFGHQVRMVCPNRAPEFLQWLPAYDDILIFDDSPEEIKEAVAEAELIFAVDYNAWHRTGNALAEVLDDSKAVKFLIDHHPHPDDIFDAKISDTTASSTAELVFNFIEDGGLHDKINREIAQCIYVGLLTDTGSFSYSINSEKPYLIAAALFKTGIDMRSIHQRIYSSFTEGRLRLMGHAISENLVVNNEMRYAYIFLNKSDLDRFGYQDGDTEGIVNYALGIENIVAAVLLTEKEGKIRLSFRSKGSFEVNRIAREHFGGGGHKNAAGGNSFESMEKTIQKMNAVFSEYKDALNDIQL
jgi:phosphoesterase RecJ-like protein